MAIIIQNLHKRYGENKVLRGLNLRFEEGSFTCIMGESGIGKTTLLRILMGLEQPDSGQVLGLQNKKISAVFQEDRLLDGFSAAKNLRIVCPKTTGDQEILAHLAELGLGQSLHQPVRELSGGMKRRVAIARAMLAPGQLVLLDEPLKGLDEQLKEHVAAYIKAHTNNATTIMVTHDVSEVALMGAGLIHIEGDTP